MIVKICGVPHKIIYAKDVYNVDNHLGQINYKEAEILINSESSAEIQKETLCHEILHGMLVHIGMNDLASNEIFVQALGNAIYQSFDIRMEGE